MQVIVALIVTPEGFPLGYEVLPGNTADCTTLRAFLRKIEAQYGKADRIWVMDRGIPTEAVLAEMRQSDPPVCYLVGTLTLIQSEHTIPIIFAVVADPVGSAITVMGPARHKVRTDGRERHQIERNS